MTLLEYQKETWRTCPSLGIGPLIGLSEAKCIMTEEAFSKIKPLEDGLRPKHWSQEMILNSLHMTIGMMTEIGEITSCLKLNEPVDKVNLQEELGDILWYFANYANFFYIDLTDYNFLSNKSYYTDLYTKNPKLRPMDLITIHASDLLDYDKKALAYNKSKDPEKVKKSFESLFKAISDMFLINALDPYKAMRNNIDKLRVRFPDKFTEDSAINRNLEQERIELEK